MSEIPTVSVTHPRRAAGDLLVVGVLAGERPELAGSPDAVRQALASIERRFEGGAGEIRDCPVAGGERTLSLQALGPRSELDWHRLRSWLRRVAREAARGLAGRVTVFLPDHEETTGETATQRIAIELAMTGYRFEAFRGARPEDPAKRVSAFRLVPPLAHAETARRGARWAAAAAAGIGLARDLGNTPPNVATPAWMAGAARELGGQHEMRVQVLSVKELERRKMGGVLAVGAGSAHPPCLVRLRWGTRGPRIALVGKGVTFDSGGLSIKPATSMEEMKYDKCGACTVLGVLKAAAILRLPVRLSAYLPLAENLPDAKAYRPSDIIRCHNGKTVEIVNTDAEGRLILADALSWAVKEGCDALLEMSTLTGAAVVALGEEAAALYTPSGELADELAEAASTAAERFWRMPLWPEFLDQMKGNHADLKNSGGRGGGANTAAAFLSAFVGSTERWAHLDIAGPAYAKKTAAGEGMSATGFGVATVLNWLRSQT